MSAAWIRVRPARFERITGEAVIRVDASTYGWIALTARGTRLHARDAGRKGALRRWTTPDAAIACVERLLEERT